MRRSFFSVFPLLGVLPWVSWSYTDVQCDNCWYEVHENQWEMVEYRYKDYESAFWVCCYQCWGQPGQETQRRGLQASPDVPDSNVELQPPAAPTEAETAPAAPTETEGASEPSASSDPVSERPPEPLPPAPEAPSPLTPSLPTPTVERLPSAAGNPTDTIIVNAPSTATAIAAEARAAPSGTSYSPTYTTSTQTNTYTTSPQTTYTSSSASGAGNTYSQQIFTDPANDPRGARLMSSRRAYGRYNYPPGNGRNNVFGGGRAPTYEEDPFRQCPFEYTKLYYDSLRNRGAQTIPRGSSFSSSGSTYATPSYSTPSYSTQSYSTPSYATRGGFNSATYSSPSSGFSSSSYGSPSYSTFRSTGTGTPSGTRFSSSSSRYYGGY